jgi:hypothetical protein
VEYCGKEISKEGLSMSKKKIQKVLDFPKPKTAGQMKQFVGLINYFHDFCSHHAHIVRPLHDMIKNYQRRLRDAFSSGQMQEPWLSIRSWQKYLKIIRCFFQERIAL